MWIFDLFRPSCIAINLARVPHKDTHISLHTPSLLQLILENLTLNYSQLLGLSFAYLVHSFPASASQKALQSLTFNHVQSFGLFFPHRPMHYCTLIPWFSPSAFPWRIHTEVLEVSFCVISTYQWTHFLLLSHCAAFWRSHYAPAADYAPERFTEKYIAAFLPLSVTHVTAHLFHT